MGKVFLSITMSLDSFTAEENIRQENPMGVNGQLLHKWLFANKQKEDEEVAIDIEHGFLKNKTTGWLN